MSKNRNWCFTLNNYTEKEVQHLENGTFKYLVYGLEVGESGTPHLQGYIEFTNDRYLSGVKKVVSERAHLEVRRGTAKQAREYCIKDGEWKEFGEMSVKGQRTDLIEIKDQIMGGADMDDVVLENPMVYCKYKNGLDRIHDIALRQRKRTKMTKGLWLHGFTGVGKSHHAFDIAGDDVYVWTDDNGWWDGYKGQRTVIINDFRGGIKYNDLLLLIDKWPHSVRRRGREPMPFTSELVIITSSMTPSQVYKNLDECDGLEQLLRRIELIQVRKDGINNLKDSDDTWDALKRRVLAQNE